MGKRVILKQEITEVARKIFNTLGFKKASMNDIAKSVSKKKSSIYYYFKSKEEIFSAVVLQEAKVFRSTIMQAVAKETNPQNKLKAFVLTRMQIIDKLDNFNKALQDRKLMHLEFVVRLKKLYDAEEVRLFRNILKEGVKSGFFQINDIDLAATAIITSMRGMENTFHNYKNDKKIDEKIDGIIYTIMYGIVKR